MESVGRAIFQHSYLIVPCHSGISVKQFSKGYSMGKLKRFWEDMLDAEGIEPPIKTPTVHILLCNGKPVHAYVDLQTAEYEMHLCIQGDEQELGQCHSYELITLQLSTNRLD